MRCLAAITMLAMVMTSPAGAVPERPRDWNPPPIESIPNHRQDWRDVVVQLSSYAKGRSKNFLVLVRGGVELVVKGDREAQWEQERDPEGLTYEKRLPLGTVFRPYMKAVDALVVDGLYCGQYAFDKPLNEVIKTRKELDAVLAEERSRGIHRPPVPVPMGPFSLDPKEELNKHSKWKLALERQEIQRRRIYAIDGMRANGRRILSIEDCPDAKAADAAWRAAKRDGVMTYAGAGIARLDTIPHGHVRAENAASISAITSAENWLPVLRGDRYGTKAEWLMAMERTNSDVLVTDVSHRGTDPLTKDDVRRLKFKRLGPQRLVLADLPLGRASDGRWYWKKEWQAGSPSFLFAPDPAEPGSFYADLSDPKWRELIGKFLAGIVDLGFDGVMIDDLDTYLWFEDLMPLRE